MATSVPNTLLGRVKVFGGRPDTPCYEAELRAALRLKDVVTDQVVRETAGLRALIMSTVTENVEIDPGGTVQLHTPYLLRLHAAAYPEYDADRLRVGGKEGKVLPLAGHDYGDWLVTPASAQWPDQTDTEKKSGKWDPDHNKAQASVPHFRVEGGDTQLMLQLDDSSLCILLGAEKKSLFGGLKTEAVSRLPLALMAEGIEFTGSLPDPTRDYGGRADASIKGRFRLEYDLARDKVRKDGGYLLRLVAEPGADRAPMDALEARIGAAFTDLALEGESPLAISLDRRPLVPPLIWPLKLKGNRLTLIPVAGSAGDFEMEIDRSAVSVRLRTRSNYPGEVTALASVLVERIRWIKTAAGFDLHLTAGTLQNPELSLAFTKGADDGWTTALTGTAGAQSVTVPLFEHAGRMLNLYRQARAKAPDDKHPSFLYFPVAGGWLQLGLPKEKDTAAQPPESVQKTASVLAGNIVAGTGTGAGRGIRINDALALALTMHWETGVGPIRARRGQLTVSGAKAMYRGFLFAAETSPTAAEALPDLRRGPAATRELPICLGASTPRLGLKGKFTWQAADDSWQLEVEQIVGGNLDTGPVQHIAWLPAGPNPFISNHTLTRSVASATEPSISRSLLPMNLGATFTLSLEANAALPRLLPKSALTWHYVFPERGAEFRADTLLLPSLAGIEFLPPIPGQPLAIEAALRFDVPQLDELFAWSDPPLERDTKVSPEKIASVAVTSLDLEGMRKVWGANRVRLALTRTQSAFASPWQTVGGTATAIAVDGLVEPYSWKTSFKVDITSSLYGSYTLDGVEYTPERAVGGLDRATFIADDTELKPDAKGSIHVAGFAASLFDSANRRWDSRGFGMAPEATASGRLVSHRMRDEDGAVKQKEWNLFTMADVVSFRKGSAKKADPGFPLDLCFYVRDLALADGKFEGAENPVESARGVTGQAFLPSAFPGSLHEWRFFEAPDGPEQVRRHDIAYGPFRFKPLRLLHASFDSDGVPTDIQVVGSMRLDLDPALSAEAAKPFGPDEVYRGGDLFKLTLKHDPATSAWSHSWLAVASVHDDKTGLLKFMDRKDDNVGCSVVLAASAEGIGSKKPVAATISLGLTSRDATLRARLFGNDAILFCEAYKQVGDGIDLVFTAPAPDAHDPNMHGIWLIDVATTVSIRKAGSTLRIDGALAVMADGATAPTVATALAVFRTGSWQWLDLKADAALNSVLWVDHNTGVVSASLSGTGTGAPLFAITHTDYVVSGNIEAVVAARPPLRPLTHNTTCIPMTSVWMRVSCIAKAGDAAIDHRLLAGPAKTEHVLDINAMVVVKSAIAWPLNGMRKPGEVEFGLKDDTWFEPGLAGAPLNPLSRVFSIAPDARLARHEVTLQLKRHRIDAAQLVRHTRVTVRVPIRLLAVAEHRLIQVDVPTGKPAREARWQSLDSISITTAAAMLEAIDVSAEPGKRYYYWAPRYRFGTFRTAGDDQLIRATLAPMSRALSGFYDASMIEYLWKGLAGDHAHTPLFLGSSALQFRFGKFERSLLAVMPWVQLPGNDIMLEQRGGVWHTASVDIWSAHSLANMESLRAIGLAADVDAPDVARRFAAAGVAGPSPGLSLADMLPVEQSFFEKWDSKQARPMPMAAADLSRAPFFLRTLLVVARRWYQDGGVDSVPEPPVSGWDVASLHPCTTDGDASRGPGVIRVEIRADTQRQVPYREPVTMLPADLVVLSRDGARRIGAYRLVAKAVLMGSPRSKLNAALVERALDEDRAALIAIQEVGDEGAPLITVASIPGRLDDWLTRPASEIQFMPRIGPSGALGWPSSVALQGLERMGPSLGAELPVLSPEAGFAARFQRFGWPAFAVCKDFPEDGVGGPLAPEAYYLSFANRVAYDRDTALAFDGPPARHLIPAPVRRRAPVSSSVERALLELTGVPGGAEPLLLPGIERATLGRRPGVFEVAVASLTIPADEGSFDPDHARFGRPGNSGPVAAHQLRSPRSPLLPGDADDELIAQKTGLPELAFRRRTYLSEADLDSAGHYTLFKTFDGNVDILRIGGGTGQVRVALRILGGELIGQNWNGKLSVAVSARKAGGVEGGNKIAGLELDRAASLEIGSSRFALSVINKVEFSADFSWECTQVAQVRALLRAASVDTSIRLLFWVRPSNVASGNAAALPEATVSLCTIRLVLDPGIRSVLPVRTTTIAFGDPSYDRQLASPTRFHAKEVAGSGNSKRIVLATDRKEYDVGSTLYLAFGVTARESGLFAKDDSDFKPRLRITFSRAGDRDHKPVLSAPLAVEDVTPGPDKRYPLDQGKPYAIALSQLYSPEEASTSSALLPGDRLTLSMLYDATHELVVEVDIVAQAVVAPAPCVFSVIGPGAEEKSMSVVLHAAGPLPQRIEFEDLTRDLALGQVRRRALFIWRWATVAGADSRVELVKFDRSGGAQVPPSVT
ncbi:hypothetical protein [Pseudomonas nunensis]|uniref:Uncharacterized protein n=1 Tax=Pseudomonas nunensis TaxID=2961896 RepID=A0ABY5EBP7_9PSED|nr:hypothetical protein [Pseudomonas nunensis]KPN91541.1 hypothetical protein AL066_14800 [Pseudomonas nunensis]MCL5229775.1 hypothetical protein [Pseudomonas nunensis]UTO11740.1 hypothetical protein NK667_16200 [Pseudomonas nunensis]